MIEFFKKIIKQYRCKHTGTMTTLHVLEANLARLHGDDSKMNCKAYSIVCLNCDKTLI